MTPYQREALQDALKGDFNKINAIEMNMAKDSGLTPRRPGQDAEEAAFARYRLTGHTLSSNGRSQGFVFRESCEECDGARLITRQGNAREWEIECPRCKGTGNGPGVATTDPNGIILSEQYDGGLLP